MEIKRNIFETLVGVFTHTHISIFLTHWLSVCSSVSCPHTLTNILAHWICLLVILSIFHLLKPLSLTHTHWSILVVYSSVLLLTSSLSLRSADSIFLKAYKYTFKNILSPSFSRSLKHFPLFNTWSSSVTRATVLPIQQKARMLLRQTFKFIL